MEVLKLSASTLDKCVARAAEVLRAGGVVLYPTDTLYGLGADAFSDEVVAKIYKIKGRDEGKPIHALVDTIEMAERYAELTDDARLLAERLLQGQVTFILRKKVGVDAGIARGITTFGFRIPDNDFCLDLVRALGTPVTATSANKSGEKPECSVEKILAQLGEQANYIALVIDADELPPSEPSSVMDLSGEEPVLLREGAIAAAEIWKVLRRSR
jgi:L-threonylcarbamoyladenylate synthase